MNWTKYVHTCPDVFIDVGPGVLNSEAWIIKKACKNCKIVGLEPDLARYNNLKSKYPGELINCAVSNKDGKIKMYRVDGMSVNFPRPHQYNKNNIFEINAISIDSLITQKFPRGKIFIWADIEGAELTMLQGARQALASNRVIGLYLEVWNEFQTNNWAARDQINKFLSEYNYKEKHIITMGKHHGDVIFLQ